MRSESTNPDCPDCPDCPDVVRIRAHLKQLMRELAACPRWFSAAVTVYPRGDTNAHFLALHVHVKYVGAMGRPMVEIAHQCGRACLFLSDAAAAVDDLELDPDFIGPFVAYTTYTSGAATGAVERFLHAVAADYAERMEALRLARIAATASSDGPKQVTARVFQGAAVAAGPQARRKAAATGANLVALDRRIRGLHERLKVYGAARDKLAAKRAACALLVDMAERSPSNAVSREEFRSALEIGAENTEEK